MAARIQPQIVDREPAVGPSSGWACAIVVAVAAAVYANGLPAVFVFDDYGDILRNTSIRTLWPPWDIFVHRADGHVALQGRPLVNLSFALNHALGGTTPWGYRLVNIAVHALAGLTLLGIVRRTLQLPSIAPAVREAAGPLSLIAALLWVVHPLQTESVTYVVQRYESMMALGYLLTLYCALRGATSSRPGPWTVATALACLAALACKEVAITAPLVVLLYDRTFLAGSFRGELRQRAGLYAGLAAAVALFLLHFSCTGSRSGWAGSQMGVSRGEYLLTQCNVLAYYVRLIFWPHPLVLDYGWQVAKSPGEVLPGAIVIAGLLAATAVALARAPRWGFLGACWFLILAPTSSIGCICRWRQWRPWW